MSVNAHLIDHRFLRSVASLIHLHQKRSLFLIPLDWSCGLFGHGVIFGRRMGSVLAVLICLTWPLVALCQQIDEGEFSRKMLGYKLQLLEQEFKQSEMRLLTGSVAASRAKKLEHVYNQIQCLETEFRFGRYYPDLFDEHIVIIREELRQILADPAKSTSMSEPGVL
jgi:hypothetical protein